MSDVSTLSASDYSDPALEQYRAVSKSAILSLILGLLSLAALSIPPLAVIPCIGLLLGWSSLRRIRRHPMEVSGLVPAAVGTLLCAGLLVGSVTLHAHTYATECPEGYQRISFDTLRPIDERPELPVSPAAVELNGKKVFIKGYVYPDGQQDNIRRFVLVPDMGTCCFGGQPKLTDMIEVTLTDPDRIKYSLRRRKLAGELVVDTQLKPISGLGGVYFQLKAHVVD
jgi:hypothetical protein